MSVIIWGKPLHSACRSVMSVAISILSTIPVQVTSLAEISPATSILAQKAPSASAEQPRREENSPEGRTGLYYFLKQVELKLNGNSNTHTHKHMYDRYEDVTLLEGHGDIICSRSDRMQGCQTGRQMNLLSSLSVTDRRAQPPGYHVHHVYTPICFLWVISEGSSTLYTWWKSCWL